MTPLWTERVSVQPRSWMPLSRRVSRPKRFKRNRRRVERGLLVGDHHRLRARMERRAGGRRHRHYRRYGGAGRLGERDVSMMSVKYELSNLAIWLGR